MESLTANNVVQNIFDGIDISDVQMDGLNYDNYAEKIMERVNNIQRPAVKSKVLKYMVALLNFWGIRGIRAHPKCGDDDDMWGIVITVLNRITIPDNNIVFVQKYIKGEKVRTYNSDLNVNDINELRFQRAMGCYLSSYLRERGTEVVHQAFKAPLPNYVRVIGAERFLAKTDDRANATIWIRQLVSFLGSQPESPPFSMRYSLASERILSGVADLSNLESYYNQSIRL